MKRNSSGSKNSFYPSFCSFLRILTNLQLSAATATVSFSFREKGRKKVRERESKREGWRCLDIRLSYPNLSLTFWDVRQKSFFFSSLMLKQKNGQDISSVRKWNNPEGEQIMARQKIEWKNNRISGRTSSGGTWTGDNVVAVNKVAVEKFVGSIPATTYSSLVKACSTFKMKWFEMICW